jgi:hypothetical protein
MRTDNLVFPLREIVKSLIAAAIGSGIGGVLSGIPTALIVTNMFVMVSGFCLGIAVSRMYTKAAIERNKQEERV